MKCFRKLCRAFDSLAIDYYTDGNLYTDVQYLVDDINAVKISETDLKYDFSGAFTYYDAVEMAGFLVFIKKFDNFSQYMKAMWYAYSLFYDFKTFNVCGLYDLHADNIRINHRGFVGLLKNGNTYNDETIRKDVEGVERHSYWYFKKPIDVESSCRKMKDFIISQQPKVRYVP